MFGRNRSRSDSQSTKEILRKALEGIDPEVENLLERLPAIMLEAERRRRQEPLGLVAGLGLQAPRLLSRFALVAAVLLIAMIAIDTNPSVSTSSLDSDLDSLILTGSSSVGSDDFLLEALMGEGGNNGG